MKVNKHFSIPLCGVAMFGLAACEPSVDVDLEMMGGQESYVVHYSGPDEIVYQQVAANKRYQVTVHNGGIEETHIHNDQVVLGQQINGYQRMHFLRVDDNDDLEIRTTIVVDDVVDGQRVFLEESFTARADFKQGDWDDLVNGGIVRIEIDADEAERIYRETFPQTAKMIRQFPSAYMGDRIPSHLRIEDIDLEEIDVDEDIILSGTNKEMVVNIPHTEVELDVDFEERY